MKKTILTLGLLTLSTLAFAAPQSIQVECSNYGKDVRDARPGQELVTLTGTLQLSKHPTYPAPAKSVDGTLELAYSSARKGSSKTQLRVGGQYDKVAYGEYANLVSDSEKIGNIYIDFSMKDNLSYIEIQGASIPLKCSKK